MPKLPRNFASLVLIVLLWIAACTPTPATLPPPTATTRPTNLGANLVKNPPFVSLTYGIHAFMWWNPVTRALDLEHIRLMDFSHVKQIFAWDTIQPLDRGSFDWSRADELLKETEHRGIKVIARVDHPPKWAIRTQDTYPLDLQAWEAFCGTLAARYKGRIAGYQIWNEPNLSREWFGRTPSPVMYAALLKTCHGAMKAADPNAVIISAGLAPTGTNNQEAIPDDTYLIQLYESGFSDYHDVLGVHAPGYKSPPQTDPGDPSLQGQRWQSFRHVEDIRAIQVSKGDGAKQIAILEMGWTLDKVNPAYSWFAVTEAQQAEYLVGAYQYAASNWRPWMGVMITIYLPDPDWTEAREEYWWAISTPGYSPQMRPAFMALSNMARARGDVMTPPRDPGKAGGEFTPSAPRTP